MERLVVEGCDARLVDRSRTRGEIFIIPFKNLHRKIRLTYCARVAIFSIERWGGRKIFKPILFPLVDPAYVVNPHLIFHFSIENTGKSGMNRKTNITAAISPAKNLYILKTRLDNFYSSRTDFSRRFHALKKKNIKKLMIDVE